MVTIRHDNAKSCQWQILARSNASISLENLLLVALGLSLFILGVSIWLTLQGFWLVLVFGCIQIVVVCWAFYTAWRHNWIQEVIEITEKTLRLRHRSLKLNRVAEFPAAWVRVQLETQTRDWYSPRLLLSAMGKSVEIGRFLNQNEKHELAKHLRQALSERDALQVPAR